MFQAQAHSLRGVTGTSCLPVTACPTRGGGSQVPGSSQHSWGVCPVAQVWPRPCVLPLSPAGRALLHPQQGLGLECPPRARVSEPGPHRGVFRGGATGWWALTSPVGGSTAGLQLDGPGRWWGLGRRALRRSHLWRVSLVPGLVPSLCFLVTRR